MSFFGDLFKGDWKQLNHDVDKSNKATKKAFDDAGKAIAKTAEVVGKDIAHAAEFVAKDISTHVVETCETIGGAILTAADVIIPGTAALGVPLLIKGVTGLVQGGIKQEAQDEAKFAQQHAAAAQAAAAAAAQKQATQAQAAAEAASAHLPPPPPPAPSPPPPPAPVPPGHGAQGGFVAELEAGLTKLEAWFERTF